MNGSKLNITITAGETRRKMGRICPKVIVLLLGSVSNRLRASKILMDAQVMEMRSQ